MSWLRRKIQRAKTGRSNWFGTGADGDIRITSAGAEQSFDGGLTWTAIPGWMLVGSTVSIPSVQDGDMVVVNARTLTVDTGYTLTVANRCRGLLIYCTGNMTIGGVVSMSARGCHANPADSEATENTPVAPGDGHAVPETGIPIRRLAKGYTDTNTADTLMHGCGQAAVDSEAHQPPIKGNGRAWNIPREGGPGGAATSAVNEWGHVGGTKENAPGGGGSGSTSGAGGSYRGGNATCFSGGPGSGGTALTPSVVPPDDYGGRGGDGSPDGPSGGGAGNPSGATYGSAAVAMPGTGGLLILFCGGILTISGTITSEGSPGAAVYPPPGGSSGGGVIALFYAMALVMPGSTSVAGGVCSLAASGNGGAGAVIGPHKIDPA